MITQRRLQSDTLNPGPNQTTYIDKPTVQQLKIAFQDTPIKLREIEQGWKGRRRARTVSVGDTSRAARTPSKSPGSRPRRQFPALAEDQATVPVPSQPYLPSPPLTPFEQHDRDQETASTTQSPTGPKPLSLRPILANPLMPTRRPIKVVPGTYMSVPDISHQSEYEIMLEMGSQRIIVAQGGTSLSTSSSVGKRDAELKSRSISLSGYRNWTEEEKEQWTLVAELVEIVKRKTPRVSEAA